MHHETKHNIAYPMSRTALSAVALIAAAVSIAACFPLPIGYYTFMRIVVFIAAAIVIIQKRDEGLSTQNIATGLLAILLNPIIPIHLQSKTAWVVIDIIAAAWFIYLAFSAKRDNQR